MDMMRSAGETLANLSINTDKTNRDLEQKIDTIIAMQDEKGSSRKKNKSGDNLIGGRVRLVGSDSGAKDVINEKKRLIADAIAKLHEDGEI